MAATNLDFLPPPEPPQYLDFEGARHLAVHGWLPVRLPASFYEDLDILFGEGALFFSQSDAKKRLQYPSSRGTECGFYHVPGEKEYITFRHHRSESLLEGAAGRVWQQSAYFLHRILCDLSRAGGCDIHVWDHLLDGSCDMPNSSNDMQTVTSLLRLFRYNPEGGIADEHVDIGLLTLCVGTARGLQVLDRETGQYADVAGPVVLIGDFCRVLMKNRVRAGKHRVVSNPDGRSSVVFALRPCLRSPTDLDQFGGSGVVDTREFFYKIKGAKYSVNATKEIRAKQQRDQKARRESCLSLSKHSDKTEPR